MPEEPPTEEWEDIRTILKEEVRRNEQLEAKVVLQEAHLEALRLKLGDKERPKAKVDASRIPELKVNTIMTSKEIIGAARKRKDAKLQEEAEKEARAIRVATNKEAAAW